MAQVTLEMLHGIDHARYPSNLLKEYYEVIRELMTALACLDGQKTEGEGAHRVLLDYVGSRYLAAQQALLIDELRQLRNRIAYEGFMVRPEYLDRRRAEIDGLCEALSRLIVARI